MKRIAIIHDWLTGMRGGERCLEIIARQCETVDIYTLFCQPPSISAELRAQRIISSPFNRLPQVARYYRYLLPLYPLAAWLLGRQLKKEHRKNPYDLVISISHCVAKNVPTPKGVPHLCYCLTPMRYIWDQFDAYFKGRPVEKIARLVAYLLRYWDVRGARHVTHFVAISDFVRQRVERLYHREASIIFPPVRTDWLKPEQKVAKGQQFLAVNALVPYKNVDKLILAFNALNEPLAIVGTGPEEQRLKAMANANITFLGKVTDSELANLYKSSRALVFAAEEDFGMAPVEMQAVGNPVIAYKRGGSLETICAEHRARTGVYFSNLSTGSIIAAVREFITNESLFRSDHCRQQARNFSDQVFVTTFQREISILLNGREGSSAEQRIANI